MPRISAGSLVAGFIVWAITDYYFTQLVVPSFLRAEDKRVWLQALLLAFQFMPLYFIGLIIVIGVQVFIFSWIISWIWDRVRH